MKIKSLPCCFWLFLFVCSSVHGVPGMIPSEAIFFPKEVNGWRSAGEPQRIDENNIFEYMNGAGELYLSFNLDHLRVFEYRDGDSNSIVVEVYWMENSNDAFGRLSLDWGGESVDLGFSGDSGSLEEIVPSSRALYGRGLLRVWSENLHLRILGPNDSPAIRETILELGRLAVSGQEESHLPDLLGGVSPAPEGTEWILKKERTSYFHSHLVLNSVLYLSHENILKLGPDTDCLKVSYGKDLYGSTGRSVDLLLIRYPGSSEAAEGLESFIAGYLPESKIAEFSKEGDEVLEFARIEDGWLGFRLAGRFLAMVFACPDQATAATLLQEAVVIENLPED